MITHSTQNVYIYIFIMMSNYPDEFAGYLHNQYGYPTDIEKQAIQRVTSVVPNMAEYLLLVISKYFGNREKNKSEGLTIQYNELNKFIVKNKLIGLIYWGADGSKDSFDTLVSEYVTINQTKIELTTGSICKYLLDEFITRENVEELCRVSLT